MTLEEKFEEAEFFLNKIKETDPDIAQVKYYFSAFLYSIESIPDYLLAEAAIKYNLDLPMEGSWHPDQFEKKSKDMNKQDALNFYHQWSKTKKAIEQTDLGKIFHNMRNMHTHKTIQRPDYFRLITNKNPKDGECKWYKLLLHPKGHPTLEVATDTAGATMKHHLNSWNNNRGEDEQLTEDDMIVKLSIGIEGFQHIELTELCEEFLQMMKKVVEISSRF